MLKWNHLKHRHKIAVSILVFTLIPMLILSAFLLHVLWNIHVASTIENNRSQLGSRVESVNELLAASLSKILFINSNFDINNFLVKYDEQDLLQLLDFNNYLQMLISVMTVENPSTDITVYVLDDAALEGKHLKSIRFLKNVHDQAETGLSEMILGQREGSFVWKIQSMSDGARSGHVHEYLCLYRKMIYLNRPLAITEVKIPFKRIVEYFSYEIPKGSFIVFQLHGDTKRVLHKTDEAAMPDWNGLELDIHAINPSEHYVIHFDLKAGVGSVSMFLPKYLVFQGIIPYLISAALIFVFTALLLFFTAEVVSSLLTKKLKTLLADMNTDIETLIQSENPKLHGSEDEFAAIGSMFVDLFGKVKDYYRRIAQYETDMILLEVQLLQERINPHFLYNTLSTMKWIYRDKGIQTVLDSMVKYYRIALNRGSSLITIAQELEMIEEYLKLQIFAYGNEFKYSIHVEEGVGKYIVLKHLLQPVVENAVLHGLNGVETEGLLTISARLSETAIVFEISDNGAGMDSALIKKILNESKEDISGGGYGLKNIMKRMKVFYGKEYGIRFDSTPSKGTTVTIKIPAVLNPDYQGRIS